MLHCGWHDTICRCTACRHNPQAPLLPAGALESIRPERTPPELTVCVCGCVCVFVSAWLTIYMVGDDLHKVHCTYGAIVRAGLRTLLWLDCNVCLPYSPSNIHNNHIELSLRSLLIELANHEFASVSSLRWYSASRSDLHGRLKADKQDHRQFLFGK